MAASRHHALLGLVDSESEDDLGMRVGATRTTTANMGAARKGRAAAANKVTKPAQKGRRRSSDRIAAAVEQTGGRQALADKTNALPAPAAKKGRKPAATAEDAAKPKAARGRPRVVKAVQAEEEQEVPDSAERVKVPAKRGRKPAAAKVIEVAPEELDETEIPETQQPAEPMDVDETDDISMDDAPQTRRPVVSSVQKTEKLASAANSRKHAASEQGDAALRARLDDLTRRYESLEASYQELREIGIKEADRNFDKLRKQGDEKTKLYNELVANLKADVAEQRELAKDGARFKKQWETSEAKVDSLQAKITETSTALSEARAENKALAAKLAAARTAEAAAVKVPGSALKPGSAAARGAAEAMQASAQVAQMKEDLYGDLTGLIVRSVKREGEHDVYDCIQTGRNGTLHFKLSVGYDESSGDSYDEAQFSYRPQLNPSRDAELIDMLPDYLVEEIEFPRPHAAKFYARVMKSLTERLE